MKKFYVALIAVGLFLLVGCSVLDSGPKPGPVTEAKVILGTWHRDGGYVQYNEDGTYLFSTLRDNLPERPAIAGEYWFKEGQYFEKNIKIKNVAPHCGSIIGIYQVQMLENGNLLFTVVEDECEKRAISIANEYKRIEQVRIFANDPGTVPPSSESDFPFAGYLMKKAEKAKIGFDL